MQVRCSITPLATVADVNVSECFIQYVGAKVTKRLEFVRVRHAPTAGEGRQLLVPMSFGMSSIVLLHILSHLHEHQIARTKRAGFTLHVVHVCDDVSTRNTADKSLHILSERYPGHTYSTIDLSSALSTTGMQHIDIPQPIGESDLALESLLNSLASPTARADMIITLRRQALVQKAKDTGCEHIIWSDCTTKLAAKVLAETAKGRGFSVPWQVSDGMTPFGVNFTYPLRDMMEGELESYAEALTPSLTPLVEEGTGGSVPVATKNQTIDSLMQEYFTTTEMNYPNIVTNVVRTANKLEAPSSTSAPQACRLCKMPVPDSAFGLLGWGGYPKEDEPSAQALSASNDLCYGCTRSMLGAKA